MSFATVLDEYCQELGATNREIAERCNVSPSALSRYRAGERTPEAGGEVLSDLATGIAELARERGIGGATQPDSVLSALEVALTGSQMVGMNFARRLDALMSLLDIRNADLARAANVDPSYLSRIRSGQRSPADQRAFTESCARFAAKWCFDHGALGELKGLVSSADEVAERLELNLDHTSDLAELLFIWLLGDNMVESDLVVLDRLLHKLDAFEFDRYLDSIDGIEPFGEIDPELLKPHRRFYYGLDDMLQAELDFFAIAAATDVREITLSSDIPLLQLSVGASLVPRIVERVLALIQQGCRVNIIHNVDRPLAETLQALSWWIPLYLTDMVTPYYLRGVHNRLFCHANNVCETCALASEAVIGHQEDGRYYLTTEPDELAYFQRKKGYILEKTSQLVEVYRESEPGHRKLFKQVEGTMRARGNGRRIAEGRYEHLRILSYPGDCAIVSILREPATHFVVRNPKISYAISHMDLPK